MSTWNAFRAEHAGSGLSVAQLSRDYRILKSEMQKPAPKKQQKVQTNPAKSKMSLITSPLLRSSMWSQAAMTLHSAWRECSMDQVMFFKFVQWVKPPEVLKLEEQVRRKLQPAQSVPKRPQKQTPTSSDSESDSESESESETEEAKGEAEARMDWLISNGWDYSPKWMCNFATQKLGVNGVEVLSFVGVGMRSFVAMVLHKGEKRAMRVTHLETNASAEEARIQVALSANGLAPRVLHREKTDRFNIEIMDAVVTTLGGFLELVTLDKRVAGELGNVLLHILSKLDALKIMHGDFHLDNIGITVEGAVLIFDFDQSSSRFSMPGFDLAVLYDVLDPDVHDDRNKQFLTALRRLLFKHLHKNWVKNKKVFNEAKVDHTRQLWANFTNAPTLERRRKLEEFAGPLVVHAYRKRWEGG